ncbi:4607_t:CDS:2 [Ambispora leptoticha]|uniref:4607_t:CDS:1 n=1 Tax=Ambispora leptoticha TaxID=144679 RepID=A0A9N8VE61_9GLOM|nr:4607_t:CDS:2 [Ambispora leptoticha]
MTKHIFILFYQPEEQVKIQAPYQESKVPIPRVLEPGYLNSPPLKIPAATLAEVVIRSKESEEGIQKFLNAMHGHASQ